MKVNQINPLHHFKNIAARRTVDFKPTNHDLSSLFRNTNRPLLPSSFPQRFRGRTNDAFSGPHSRRMRRVNKKE